MARGITGMREAACAALAVLALMLLLVAPAGARQQGSDYWVTVVARECDDYTDITANHARNNLMESLRDLGGDSLYAAGEPIDPRTEAEGQTDCRPITGWRFTFGSGIQAGASTGPWGALSIVTEPRKRAIETKDSVPARDFEGHPVAGARIAGAETIGLDRDETDLAASGSLWIQGGTPGDPVLFGEPRFAGRYGFGALRCAIDGLNGDNVETIQFPAGTRHMYCFAYYVTPPPTSGTIVIRKQVEGGGDAGQTFRFSGTVSYDPGGAFDLHAAEGAPASASFVRAETRPGDAPWTVVEDVPDGWTLTDIDCTAGASTVTADVPSGRVDIELAAGDTVTCTYVDRLTPPAGALLIGKVSSHGVGTFRFRVRDQDGNVAARARATTRRAGVPAAARPLPIELDPGRYTVSERLPASRDGVWRRRAVVCNGRRGSTVEITGGRGAVCVFANRLARPGRIAISKVTRGGTGTAAFTISSVADPSLQRNQTATTRQPGRPVRARGDSTRGLPFGRYVIQESAADPAQAGNWALVEVDCNGALVPWEQGRVTVRVTRRHPRVHCRFVDERIPDRPEPPGPDPVPGGPSPNLALDKALVHVGGGPAPVLTFRVTVANRSRVSATGVVVADRLSPGTTLVSIHPSQGRCYEHGLVICTLGGIAGGGHATITARVRRDDVRAGANVAVAGSGSPDPRSADNRDRVRVKGARSRHEACPAARPRAHAAC